MTLQNNHLSSQHKVKDQHQAFTQYHKTSFHMTNYKNLFEEFQPATKEDWVGKVLKELKGKPKETLDWTVSSDLTLPPFFHREEGIASAGPMIFQKENNDWEIGEDIWVADLEQANKDALQALTNGVESICFVLPEGLQSLEDLEKLMLNIEPTFISVYFKLMNASNVEDLVNYWITYVQKRGADPAEISGGISTDFFEADEPTDFGVIKKMLEQAGTFPNFSFLNVSFNIYESDLDGQIETMAMTLAKGSEYLASLSNLGLPKSMIQKQLKFDIEIGNSYLIEIAKVRAFQLMWSQILQAYGLKGTAFVNARLSASAYADDQYSNMIRGTAMGMSAVIGGINRLTILPANATKEAATDFTRRVARNLQHLFKMESYLDRVVDPAAGSYYLEYLTQYIGKKCWARFQEIEKEGGYLKL